MKSNLALLLEEFLAQEAIEPILARAKEMDLTVKVRKIKGRWHRETLRRLIKNRGKKCETCNISGDDDKLTLDHIIPKKMLLDMGLEEYYTDEDNLQILCSKCNGKKGSQLDFNNSKTIPLLEKYISMYKKSTGEE
jgi:5-methylcytosine-specific restriction endonuclease McrA